MRKQVAKSNFKPGRILNRFFLQAKVLATIAILFCMLSCKKDLAGVVQPWYPETNESNHPILGVFESRIPCESCETLKFALAIYKDPQTSSPSTYVMSRIYVGDSDERVSNSGIVDISQGTSLDTSHIVYQLTTGAPADYQSFWKIDETLLFILDANMVPKVGDAGYGYVLNRIR
ncbi:copper resistance protein NlpE N-terminal domain-containing protein [Flavitalea sp.]|nr:copper resistance protein NlpE N-terminal domain-containing protein [Flavitalea sp.]